MISEIYERTTVNFSDGLVAENGRIEGVRILNKLSTGNNREYTGGALQDIARLINSGEGAKVFLDHPSNSEIRDTRGVRSIKDLAGYLSSVIATGDDVSGTLHVLPQHRPLIESLVKSNIPSIGLSIHAFATNRRGENGKEIIEAVRKVVSTDLVTESASTIGLFESRSQDNGNDITDDYRQAFNIHAEHKSSERSGDYRTAFGIKPEALPVRTEYTETEKEWRRAFGIN